MPSTLHTFERDVKLSLVDPSSENAEHVHKVCVEPLRVKIAFDSAPSNDAAVHANSNEVCENRCKDPHECPKKHAVLRKMTCEVTDLANKNACDESSADHNMKCEKFD